jgi:hypothetical protein
MVGYSRWRHLQEALMPRSRTRPIVRTLLVGLIITGTVAGLMPLVSTSGPATAHASVVADAGVTVRHDDDKRRKSKEDKNDEEKVLNGQVIEINTLTDPPQLIVGSVDGLTVVRVLKTDEIVRNDVHLGDYVEATGNKQNEQLFDADQLSVSERYAAPSTENDNKKH